VLYWKLINFLSVRKAVLNSEIWRMWLRNTWWNVNLYWSYNCILRVKHVILRCKIHWNREILVYEKSSKCKSCFDECWNQVNCDFIRYDVYEPCKIWFFSTSVFLSLQICTKFFMLTNFLVLQFNIQKIHLIFHTSTIFWKYQNIHMLYMFPYPYIELML